VHSQIQINPQHPKTNPLDSLIQNLITDGIILKSYSINHSPISKAIGSFADSTSELGFNKGVIISTGTVEHLAQKNNLNNLSGVQTANGTKVLNGSDIHVHCEGLKYKVSKSKRIKVLEKILRGERTFDGLRLEMELIPTSDTLAFRYLFGSEEYDEYVGSQYNDGFAFFIQGPGLEDNPNLALVPGTNTPISINNVNNGNPALPDFKPRNPTFYVKNDSLNIQYDGITRVLEVKQKVTPGESYVLTLVIADVSDGVLDSGVLLENSSFMSFSDSYVINYPSNSSMIFEDGELTLDEVIKQLREKYDQNILITGHTDSDGSKAYNLALAKRRIDGVVDELVFSGIKRNRIKTIIKGESMPIATNYDELGKEVNRRVEMRILGSSDWKNSKEETLAWNENEILFEAIGNPFKDQLVLRYGISDYENAEIIIINKVGHLVKRINLFNESNIIHIPTSELSIGTYTCVLVEDGRRVKSLKAIKSK
jgi:outer membrane protein OmpA-like peptidoglycan-associated protein